jgi:hypothetical protein
MGGLTRKPITPGTDDEIGHTLARSSSLSHHLRQFLQAGKPYLAYERGVPGFKAGTLVATGNAVTVMPDGHHPTAEELAAAEAQRPPERVRRGA